MILFILLALNIIALIVLNELGYGAIAFVPLTLLAYWLMEKIFNEKPSS